MTEAQLVEALRDPIWRLSHLYWIVDRDGAEVLFSPNDVQRRFLEHIWFRNLVLKSRQLGYSTLVQLLMLDTCLFTPNTAAAVIAQDQDAAGRIFRGKVKFAYDRLPPLVREMLPLTRDSASELILGNGSSLTVATSVRSATLQWLHVSEFGKICAKYPDKAREVITGSLPAVAQTGIVVIESTAEGREGAFYDMAVMAERLAQQGKGLSRLDYRFHFAPWFDEPAYIADPAGIIITPRDHAYFDRLEANLGITLSLGQRAWYVATRQNAFAGDPEDMRREFPSTSAECWQQSTEGVYYAEQLAAARRERRIGTVTHDPRLPVNTFWDIGLNDSMTIWFHQRVGPRDHWIDYFEGAGEPWSFYTRHMQGLGYTWGKHYLPHDGTRRTADAEILKTPVDILEGLGLRNIEVVPITPSVITAIQQCRDAFAGYWFDETRCGVGINHIGMYRKEWNDRLGVWSSTPRHDEHSHAADALRQHAQMFQESRISAGQRPSRTRARVSAMAT